MNTAIPQSWASVARELRDQRRLRQIGIEQIASHTQMSESGITAIEQGRFDSFASPLYAAGFARSYAWAVGLPDQPVRKAVMDGFDELSPARAPRGQHAPHWLPWLLLGSGLGIVAVLLAMIVLLLG